MNYFDKYNYNLFDMTGEQLTDLMIELVDHWWEDESRYVFHYFNPRHDSSEVFFSLKPKPKRKQPGNGLLVIGNEPCRWSDMRRFVEGSHFSSCWSNYLHQYFDRRTFFKAENKACVLLSFEIARRAYIESRFLYPVTRQMTISAIRTVMSLEVKNSKIKVVCLVLILFMQILKP